MRILQLPIFYRFRCIRTCMSADTDYCIGATCSALKLHAHIQNLTCGRLAIKLWWFVIAELTLLLCIPIPFTFVMKCYKKLGLFPSIFRIVAVVLQKRIVVLDAGSLEYRFIIKSELLQEEEGWEGRGLGCGVRYIRRYVGLVTTDLLCAIVQVRLQSLIQLCYMFITLAKIKCIVPCSLTSYLVASKR